MAIDSNSLSILLVDDDDAHAELIIRSVKKAGYDRPIHRVGDGQQAIDFLMGKERFMDVKHSRLNNLVMLLDINMPIMDGYEVLKSIRANKQTQHLVVIMLSTSEDNREVNKCYELGCNLYLRKPMEHKAFGIMFSQLDVLLTSMCLPSNGGT